MFCSSNIPKNHRLLWTSAGTDKPNSESLPPPIRRGMVQLAPENAFGSRTMEKTNKLFQIFVIVLYGYTFAENTDRNHLIILSHYRKLSDCALRNEHFKFS